MIRRDTYKPERYGGISLHNEPPDDLIIQTNAKLYPDMYYVYKVFSEWLGLPVSNFILGNGAENTIKNVLLAVQPKSISWSVPTWGFIEVYCAQLCCNAYKHDFYKRLTSIEPKNTFIETLFDEDVDVYYNTQSFNSVLKHTQNVDNIKKSRVSIIDLTYLSLDEIKSYASQIKNNTNPSNVIYVGSFDKLFGAGLRLGFAFFDDKYSESIQMQRENYINQLAADFILKHEFVEPEKKYYHMLKAALDSNKLPEETMLCKSFITVPYKADFTQMQHREIFIDGKWYSKFGIPGTDEEWFELQMTLGLTK